MEPIKILGLDCSPRTGSNSGLLLQRSWETANAKLGGVLEFERIELRRYRFGACRACSVCGKRKDTEEFIPCIQRDDIAAITDKMIAADAIAVATPVYFGMPSDLFSRFMMRTRPLRHRDFQLADKPVAVMAIAGRRSGGAETAIVTAWLPFIRHGCLIVGNGDGSCQYGAMGWAGPPGAIAGDDWGLEQGEQCFRRLYEVASLIRAGMRNLPERPKMRFSYTSGNRPD